MLRITNGAELSFISSGSQTNRIKEELAGMFNLKANKILLSLIGECDKNFPMCNRHSKSYAILKMLPKS